MWSLTTILALLTVFSLATFLGPWFLYSFYFKEQDLKKKYANTEWAVVTGASGGIGLQIVLRLARQGINVVMIALDDDLLASSFESCKKQFPSVQFRKVGCNLGSEGYMKVIEDATSDIQPNLIFSNAGYCLVELFHATPLPRIMNNFHCNTTAAVQISHHFSALMVERKQKGAIFLTSSPAGLLPTPMSVMYGATKIFLTQFGLSLGCELKPLGIDVLVMHPSPVDTGFYNKENSWSDSLSSFRKTAQTPERLAGCFFSSVGRVLIHEQGYFAVSVKTLLRLIDVNFLAQIMSYFVHMMGDYKKGLERSRKTQ